MVLSLWICIIAFMKIMSIQSDIMSRMVILYSICEMETNNVHVNQGK